MTRAHFATQEASSSRILLDSDAAAHLHDKGRAFVKLPFSLGGSGEPIEIQAPFIDKNSILSRFNSTVQPPAIVIDLKPEGDDQAGEIYAAYKEVEASCQNPTATAVCRKLGWDAGGRQMDKVRKALGSRGITL